MLFIYLFFLYDYDYRPPQHIFNFSHCALYSQISLSLIWDFEPASTARSYGEIKELEKFEVGHKWTKMTLV